MAHGKSALAAVLGQSDAFFTGDINLTDMSLEIFEKHFANTSKTKISKSEMRDIASLVVKTGLRKTKADVRRLVAQNGLAVNGKNVTTEDEVIKATGVQDNLIHNRYVVIKVGKKSFALVEVVDDSK